MNKILCMGGGKMSIYLAPEVEIFEISAERGFADSAIYKEPDFGWDEDDENTFE